MLVLRSVLTSHSMATRSLLVIYRATKKRGSWPRTSAKQNSRSSVFILCCHRSNSQYRIRETQGFPHNPKERKKERKKERGPLSITPVGGHERQMSHVKDCNHKPTGGNYTVRRIYHVNVSIAKSSFLLSNTSLPAALAPAAPRPRHCEGHGPSPGRGNSVS